MAPCQEETAFEHSCASLLKAVPFSPSFTVFTCPNRVLSGDPALRNPTTGTAGQRPSHYRPHSCHTACRGSIPHPTQSLCTLRNHPACYQADAYLDRSCTGSIAPDLAHSLNPLGATSKSAGFRIREIGRSRALWQAARAGCRRNQHQK